MTDFIFYANPWLLPTAMLIVLGVSLELPYQFRKTFAARVPVQNDAWNTVQTGLLALVAFILGLSFAQAEARFDARRGLVMKEANAIGTTWLRADQLDPRVVPGFRSVLTDYTASRLRAYEASLNDESASRIIEQSNRDQTRLWAIAGGALRAHRTNQGLSLLMQSLNDTIDDSAEQLNALTHHIPTAIVVLTLVLVTLGAISIGFRFARDGSRPAVLSLVYALASVLVITMVVDYDRPQSGFVRVNLDPLHIQLTSMQRR